MYSEHGFDAVIRPDSGRGVPVVDRVVVLDARVGALPGRRGHLGEQGAWRRSTGSPRRCCRARSPKDSFASTARMNSSLTRTELLAFWYWTLVMSLPPRSMSNPASRRARILFSSRALVSMNSSMSGWSTSSTTILAARRVAPPDLIVPAEASAPRMNDTGPEAVPPLDSSSLEERIRERFSPAPEPPLKMKPSSLYQFRIESIESSTARMKQARDLLRSRRSHVEPDRGVEAEHLVQQHVRELVLEHLRVGVGGEVALVLAGLGVGQNDPVDQLAQAPLAYVGAQRPPEVLGGDDGRGVQAPEVRELHALLLEDRLAALPVRLDDVATFPGDRVVRVDAGRGEHPVDRQADALDSRAVALGPATPGAGRGLGHICCFPSSCGRLAPWLAVLIRCGCCSGFVRTWLWAGSRRRRHLPQ